MGSRSGLLKTLPLLALALCQPALADDFDGLVSAEKAFAADAATRSTREAFLAALADDGLVFAPGPTNGKRVWEARTADKSHLEWTPAVAEIAASGDIGYTSGPWRYIPAGGKKPTAFGEYFTVWAKQADGRWKVLIDHGVSHPEAAFPDKVQRRGGLGLGQPPTWPVGLAELRSADLIAPGALNPRLVAADFLRLREGQSPDGRAEGMAFASNGGKLDTGLVISAAGDLAATWGGGARSPSWIRIWRRPSAEDAPGRGWQLAVDLGLPAPAAESSP